MRDRYATLDVWRAVAALSVVVFHCTNTMVSRESWAGALLLHGWTGVFVFFPVSGYCIFAAVSRRDNARIADFLRRRWRRIVPPYWASIGVTLAAAWVAERAGGASTAAPLTAAQWLSVATLTQVFAGIPGAVNPVYWSLCYEEQFYLVVACLLFLAPRRRASTILLVTIAAALYSMHVWPTSLRATGLFLDYWLAFACGAGAYLWLAPDGDRRFGVALIAVVGLTTAALRSPALVVSFLVSIAMIGFARFDRRVALSSAGRLLTRVGLMSYSLYLIHVPIGGRVVNLLRRTSLSVAAIAATALLVSLTAAWIFHRAVESRWMNTSSESSPDRAPLPAAALA